MVIVYGGSFNPPTRAHVQITDYLIEKYCPQAFVFVPVGDVYGKKGLAPFYHRQRMLKILSRRFDSIVVSDYENKESFKGTIDLLRKFKTLYNDEIYFVLGADNLQSIDRWIEYEALIREFRFIVFGRNGVDPEDFIKGHAVLSNYLTHFKIENELQVLPVSATQYREEGRIDAVPPEIHQYIKDHQLYIRGEHNEK